jgi:hypothetical protein
VHGFVCSLQCLTVHVRPVSVRDLLTFSCASTTADRDAFGDEKRVCGRGGDRDRDAGCY